MRYYHHRSFFPLVVIVLSALLAGLIYWSAQRESSSESISVQEVEPVDADAYRTELTQIVLTFEERLAASQDDLDKLLAAQTALASLLNLRVPAEFKELHLTLAVALSHMESALASEDRNIDEPLAKIAQLKQMYSWLAP